MDRVISEVGTPPSPADMCVSRMKSLSIGTLGCQETWHIDKRPHLENDVWIMELDNEVFVREEKATWCDVHTVPVKQ